MKKNDPSFSGQSEWLRTEHGECGSIIVVGSNRSFCRVLESPKNNDHRAHIKEKNQFSEMSCGTWTICRSYLRRRWFSVIFNSKKWVTVQRCNRNTSILRAFDFTSTIRHQYYFLLSYKNVINMNVLVSALQRTFNCLCPCTWNEILLAWEMEFVRMNEFCVTMEVQEERREQNITIEMRIQTFG